MEDTNLQYRTLTKNYAGAMRALQVILGPAALPQQMSANWKYLPRLGTILLQIEVTAADP
jgi:hypothetical protein